MHLFRSMTLVSLVLGSALVVGCGDEPVEDNNSKGCSFEAQTGCITGEVCEQVEGGDPACFAPVSFKGKVFDALDARNCTPDVVVYNASNRVRGALVDLAPDDVRRAIEISAFGAFLVAQQAARRMLPKGHGSILFSGATAGVKGFALSSTFAMGKFALRGLAQSMARELSPKGIHVAHFVIDGGIRSDSRPVPADAPDSLLHPDAIAETYWAVLQQHRSAWSWEVEVRPWVERF